MRGLLGTPARHAHNRRGLAVPGAPLSLCFRGCCESRIDLHTHLPVGRRILQGPGPSPQPQLPSSRMPPEFLSLPPCMPCVPRLLACWPLGGRHQVLSLFCPSRAPSLPDPMPQPLSGLLPAPGPCAHPHPHGQAHPLGTSIRSWHSLLPGGGAPPHQNNPGPSAFPIPLAPWAAVQTPS